MNAKVSVPEHRSIQHSTASENNSWVLLTSRSSISANTREASLFLSPLLAQEHWLKRTFVFTSSIHGPGISKWQHEKPTEELLMVVPLRILRH